MASMLKRHWQARQRFAGGRDWLLHLYNRVLRRFPHLPLPRRGAVVAVRLSGQLDKFFVRLGSTDLLVLDELFHTGEYAFVQDALNNVRTIVDLGANVGFSLRYWQQVFPAARMLAVEPDHDNCRLCELNAAAAGSTSQLTLVRACVGSHRRKVRLGGGEEWAYRMEESVAGDAGLTEVIPLGELLAGHFGGGEIDLLKCDIEGAEQEVFADCGAWIGRVKAIVIELHPPYSVDRFLSDLGSSGAQFEIVREFAAKQCPVLLLQNIGARHRSPDRSGIRQVAERVR